MTWAPPVPHLRTQASATHQARHAMLAATIAQLVQVGRELAIAIQGAVLQPGLLDPPRQALNFPGPGAVRLMSPHIEAATLNAQHAAHAHHPKFLQMHLHKCVLRP